MIILLIFYSTNYLYELGTQYGQIFKGIPFLRECFALSIAIQQFSSLICLAPYLLHWIFKSWWWFLKEHFTKIYERGLHGNIPQNIKKTYIELYLTCAFLNLLYMWWLNVLKFEFFFFSLIFSLEVSHGLCIPNMYILSLNLRLVAIDWQLHFSILYSSAYNLPYIYNERLTHTKINLQGAFLF